ncbi:hypothetical protein LTR97_006143 [Elasticomyces elasticus]|uniref:Uncharacterized protein n=1 Tax=Elasticomyces elasticus TaxID=574655 RepID=A0AAN7WJ82_9PEZI|nr:hypothetical protein LTR97_006143 [Elasticomyces elasticus]
MARRRRKHLLTNPKQHKVRKAKPAPYAGPDMLSPLPTELHDHILEFLVPDGDERYVNKQDIQAVHLSCHAMGAAAKPWLFRHIGVTIRLDGGLPVQNAQWEPPRLLRLLEATPWIGELVKSLQLRVEPFPTKEWTDAEFDDFVSRLNLLPDMPPINQIRQGPGLHPSFRQMWVKRRYLTHVYEWLSLWYPMVKGAQQHVTAVFKVLPALRHAEAGQWRKLSSQEKEKQWLFRDSEPHELLLLSYAGAATALLSALPSQVDSYGFRYYPHVTVSTRQHLYQDRGHLPFGIDDRPVLNAMQITHPGQDAGFMHFTTSMDLRVSQMRSFDLDFGNLQHDWIGFQHWAIKVSKGDWRRTLQSMHSLSKLGLSSCDGHVYNLHIPRDSPQGKVTSGHLSGDRAGRHLDALLYGLVMPSVTRLHLNSWAITVSTLLSVLPVAFPNLRSLLLEAVVIIGGSAKAWNDALIVLPEPTSSARSISIDILAPKYCVMEAGKGWWEVIALNSADASALRHIVKGYQHPKT